MDSTALWKYLGVYGTLMLAGMGMPIPEEAPIIAAGGMVGSGAHTDPGDPDFASRPLWWIMLPTCIVGVVMGDGILYTIGRLWGYRILNIRWVRTRLLTPEKRVRIERNFHRYGVWILLGARMLPGIRSPIFLMAGINRLPVRKFLMADGLYAIPGVSLLFFLAYYFQRQVESVFHAIQSYKPQIAMCLIAAALGYLIRYFQEHPISTGDPEDVPLIGHKLATNMKDTEGRDGAALTPLPAAAPPVAPAT